jgi:multicomponent Na+:H+ antiporter subunit B
MREPFGGLILNIAFRMLVPFTIVYGIYVLCLGEFSPGGGFQAGALLSVGVLLSRMIMGEKAKFNVSGKTSVVLAGVGTFLYTFTGWLTLFGGGRFLEYDFMPIHMEPAHEMHAMAIFMIEIGVAVCVMMTIINLMDAIIKRGDEDGSSK